MVLVLELDQGSPELGEVPVHVIGQAVTGQHCLILQYFDVVNGKDFISPDVPQCRITEEICVIVEELRRAGHLPVVDSVLLNQLH